MNLWYRIRQPIGLTLMAAIIWVAIIAAHAIPEFIVRLIIGG